MPIHESCLLIQGQMRKASDVELETAKAVTTPSRRITPIYYHGKKILSSENSVNNFKKLKTF